MEFGCGDGNQLALMRYPSYVGVDVSPSAVKLCRAQFAEDPSKKFYILDQELQAEEAPKADLTLSLDVIYHLVEDEVFERHMEALFASSRRFVGIYSSNVDEPEPRRSPHVRNRRFTDWVERHAPDWMLREHVPNEHQYEGDVTTGSWSDFYFYEKKSA